MYLLFFVSLKHPKDTPAEPTTSQHGSISDKEEHRSRLRLTSSETHSKYSYRVIRELRQTRWRRRYKFAYFTMKNSSFSRSPRAFFIFVHFEAVFVHSTTWNDLFCSCVGDVRTSSRSYQFNASIVCKRFASHTTWGIGKKPWITETRIFIFR